MPAVPAGAILKHILKKEQFSQKEIALKSNIYPQRINDLIKGKRKFTPEISNRLEESLGISLLGFFYIIQTNHDVFHFHDEQERKIIPDLKQLNKSLFWEINSFDINWIKQANWVIQRVFEYGNQQNIKEIIRFYGREKVSEILNAIPATDTWNLDERNRNRDFFGI
jgi:plasmid maintenance system antidote protein VapI